MTSITLSQAVGILPYAFRARVPVLLLSSPGVGKSAAISSLARSAYWTDRDGVRHTGVPAWLVNLQHRDPSDLLGKQVVVDTPDGPAMGWIPPVDAVRLRPHDDGSPRPAILFLDELPNAPRVVRGGMLKLLDHDRMFGSVRIADEVSVVCAGNRWTDRALGDRLDTATINRLLVLDVVPDHEAWEAWALGHARTERPWEYPLQTVPSVPVHPILMQWVAYRRREGDSTAGSEDVLRAFDPKADEGKPFASARSIDLLSRMMKSGLPDHYIDVVAEGLIGERQAPSFAAFRAVLAHLPQPQELLADPDHCVLPDQLQYLFALAGAIPHHVTAATAPAFWRLIARFGQRAKECEGLMALAAYTIHGAVAMNCPEFVQWWSKPENQMIIRRDV